MGKYGIVTTALIAISQTGCGIGIAPIPEIIDRGDARARAHLEMQIKQAIFCELRKGAFAAREENSSRYFYKKGEVTSEEDGPFPDSWGAQVTFTLTADEKSTITPGVTLKHPRFPGLAKGQSVATGFNFGFGGTISSQNVNYDKYNTYWSAAQLTDGDRNTPCGPAPSEILGEPSKSSPFVTGSGLGVSEWLPGAIAVANFRRSSRASEDGIGPPLGAQGTSDTATYSNKFVIITSGNVTPTWTLVKVTANTSSLLDLNRTRTHELIVTVGPGSITTTKDSAGKKQVTSSSPSAAALNAQFAAQIGSAVAAAIKGQ